MKKILEEVKWLFNYMASILMYSILVLLIGVGILLAAYYVDFRFKTKNLETCGKRQNGCTNNNCHLHFFVPR